MGKLNCLWGGFYSLIVIIIVQEVKNHQSLNLSNMSNTVLAEMLVVQILLSICCPIPLLYLSSMFLVFEGQRELSPGKREVMSGRATEMIPEVNSAASTTGELIKPKLLTDSFHCGHVINVILHHLQFFTGETEGWSIFGICLCKNMLTLYL